MKRRLLTILLVILLIITITACNDISDISETENETEDITESESDTQEESEIEPAVESELHGIIKSSDRLVAKSEPVGFIPYPDDISTQEQGGYTDGIHQYQFFIKKDNASKQKNNIVRLVKYDIEKQESVAVSEKLYLNHANDLTYNEKEGVLLASHCHFYGNRISMISPDTLEVVDSVDIDMDIYCITYNESRDRYAVGLHGGQDFRILDSDFEPIGPIHKATDLTEGYTTQGCASDDEYIYFVLYSENVITVYDWDGNFMSLIYLDILGETENISVVGEDIYVVTSAEDGAAIYKIDSLEKFEVSPLRSVEGEPTPAADSGKYLTDFISADRIAAYLPLDKSEKDALGKVNTAVNNTVNYIPGRFGEAASLDEGYISISDHSPENSSFAVSFWIKTPGTSGDPCIISNKDWESRNNPGFLLALTHNCTLFNMGSEDGSDGVKLYYPLPFDHTYGWMHVILSVDREAGTVSVAYDFNDFTTIDIPEALKNASFNAFDVLNIGQDGTGAYPDHLPATIDELIIFEGAFTQEDVSALAQYYGIE